MSPSASPPARSVALRGRCLSVCSAPRGPLSPRAPKAPGFWGTFPLYICLLTSTGLPGEPRKGPRLSASCIPTEALAPHRPGGLGASAAPRAGPAGSPRWKRCLCRDLWDSHPSISCFVPANRGHAEPSGGAGSRGVRTGVRAGRPPSCWARVRAGSGSHGGRGARPAVRPSDTLFSCRAVVRLRVPAPFRSLLRVRARSRRHRVGGAARLRGRREGEVTLRGFPVSDTR